MVHGHWRNALPLPLKQVAWRPCRKTINGNGPPDRSVGKCTEASSSTGPGKLVGVKAVSPKLYSSRVTASGPGAPGSGVCADTLRTPAPLRSRNTIETAKEKIRAL